jgi:ArsR family transcriptional regulator
MHQINLNLHELFQALSDPSRIRIVRLLLRAESELCLCELSESLNEPEYKLSRHLKILKNSGLISSTRDGKWIYHSLVSNKKYLKSIFQAVRAFPDENKSSEKDFLRFKKRVQLRDNGRCRQNSASEQRAAAL